MRPSLLPASEAFLPFEEQLAGRDLHLDVRTLHGRPQPGCARCLLWCLLLPWAGLSGDGQLVSSGGCLARSRGRVVSWIVAETGVGCMAKWVFFLVALLFD